MSWYIAACLLIPTVWGLAVAMIYERIAPAPAPIRPEDLAAPREES